MTRDALAHRFTYHPPSSQARNDHEATRSASLAFAEYLHDVLPTGREKSLAITKVEEAMFWANAAIARHSAENR